MSNGGDNVTIEIKGLLENLSNATQTRPKIFKVDDRLRLVKAKDYEPKILAIGPIHEGKDHLKQMEKHKVRYLRQLLQRRPDLRIETLVEKLQEMKESALQCYSTSLNLDADKFVRMLLLDGCFLIELIRKYFFNDSVENDPIFKSKTLSQIIHDLMLIENQLPFAVLNQLFEMTKTENPDDNLCHLVVFLVKDMFPWSNVLKLDPASHQNPHPHHHLLGLIHQCFTPFSTKTPSSKPKSRKERNSSVHIDHMNSASELKEAGIRLKRYHSKENNSITFKGRVLKLPPLKVSGDTESLLRNLMAYELLSLDDDRPRHVTDYTFFMHCLIRSTKDIEILRRRGIIDNYLGGDDNIYQMFDRLGTNFMLSSDSCYSHVFLSLNKHCGRRHNKWMANLRGKYFNSPWSYIKFFAATLLLLLTLAQTVFSILAFHQRNDVIRVRLT